MKPEDLLNDDGRKLCCVLEPFDSCDICHKEFCDDCSIIAGSGCDGNFPKFLCLPCYRKKYAQKRF